MTEPIFMKLRLVPQLFAKNSI